MIQWNHVTWYSKALALALFVVVSLGGFWFGLDVGYLKGYVKGARTAAGEPAVATSTVSAASSYYQNVAEWQTDQDAIGGFSVAYPIDFETTESDSAAPTQDWRMNGGGTSGNLYFTLDIPRAFEPQTNFSDAKLTIGASRTNVALANCLITTPSELAMEGIKAFPTTINGIVFSVYQFSDAGAGNYYETTSYRTVHAGQCYAAEYTIHSSQIANYPAEYGLKPFDKAKLTDVLDRIVSTFRFL